MTLRDFEIKNVISTFFEKKKINSATIGFFGDDIWRLRFQIGQFEHECFFLIFRALQDSFFRFLSKKIKKVLIYWDISLFTLFSSGQKRSNSCKLKYKFPKFASSR